MDSDGRIRKNKGGREKEDENMEMNTFCVIVGEGRIKEEQRRKTKIWK